MYTQDIANTSFGAWLGGFGGSKSRPRAPHTQIRSYTILSGFNRFLMAKNLDNNKRVSSNQSMYARDIAKTRFRAPEGALGAPNHTLAPLNEALQDSEWFKSICYGQKPRTQKENCPNRSTNNGDMRK